MEQASEQHPESSKTEINTSALHSPITSQRRPATDAARAIDRAGVPRASLAVSSDAPHGTPGWAEKHKNYSVVQQHLLYWDRDGDGEITPADIWAGFRDLGFTVPVRILACTVIPLAFSYSTRMAYTLLPDPKLRIYVGSAYKAKHGSDSGVFDNEGRFVPQKFEDLFTLVDRECDGTLTLGELFGLMHRNRVASDIFGATAAFFEWTTTWVLLERDGRVHKEDLRRIYDGSLFYHIRESRQKSETERGTHGLSMTKLARGVISDESLPGTWLKDFAWLLTPFGNSAGFLFVLAIGLGGVAYFLTFYRSR